jgi:hypothetical protein
MTTTHASPDLIARYTAGADLPVDVLWAIESHIESCAVCRAELANAVPTQNPAVATMTAAVFDTLQPLLPERRRRPFARLRRPTVFRWAAPAALPWLAMTVFVPMMATLFDLTARVVDRSGPPALLLVAPVVPVLAVAASWSRWFDPVGELICSTARSGLVLVLRRTLTVLVAVMPVLAAADLLTGAAPARWLLPCLACTATTLALGAHVGVARAAVAVTAAWTAGVIAPSLAQSQMSPALDPARTPLWAACLLVAGAGVLLWRNAFQRHISRG